MRANVEGQVCRKSGSTPLHRAVTSTGAPDTAGKRQEAVEIIRLLIAAGADPSIANKSGRKPVDYVKDDAVKSLLKPSNRGDKTPIELFLAGIAGWDATTCAIVCQKQSGCISSRLRL
jgi:hypothetical protein